MSEEDTKNEDDLVTKTLGNVQKEVTVTEISTEVIDIVPSTEVIEGSEE